MVGFRSDENGSLVFASEKGSVLSESEGRIMSPTPLRVMESGGATVARIAGFLAGESFAGAEIRVNRADQ